MKEKRNFSPFPKMYLLFTFLLCRKMLVGKRVGCFNCFQSPRVFCSMYLSKCQFNKDQSMCCPFNTLLHNLILKDDEKRFFKKHCGRRTKCCFCTRNPLPHNYPEGKNKIRKKNSEKRTKCCFLTCMRVNGQCLYWTSPCIVPLTLYHAFPSFSSLSNDKFSVLSKLKAFADDNSNVTKMTKFAGDSLENIVGKGDNAGYQHFLLFQQFFLKLPI